MEPPTLTDGRVVLRPHSRRDVAAVVAQCSDAESARWTTAPLPYRRRDAEEFVGHVVPQGWRDGIFLALAVQVDGRFAGTVDATLDGHRGAELGFGLAAWARGRGVASAAVRLLLGFSADPDVDVDVVHWRAAVGNWASRRVAWACGFAVEGRVRALLPGHGTRHDAWVGSWRPGEPMRPRQPWLRVPVLSGSGVTLRAVAETDADRVVQACSSPSTQTWLPMLPRPYTLDEARSYLRSRLDAQADGCGLYWTVTGDDDLLLGQVALMDLSVGGRSGEIGYWIHPDGRGRGVATAAVRAVVRHALLDPGDGGLGLDRVLLRVAEGNTASCRVAERAGFTAVGRDRRGELLRDGRRVDFLRYDLLAEELADSLAHPSALR